MRDFVTQREESTMKNNSWLILGLSIALSMGFATACDDDIDDNGDVGGNGGNGSQTTADQGYLSTCKAPGPRDVVYPEGAEKRSKSDAATYLAGLCRIPEYYTKDEFLKAPKVEFENATAEQQGIGAPCFCFGKNCEYMKYERPEVGGVQAQNDEYYKKEKMQQAMFGCDSVQETYKGAVRTCFRSSEVERILPSIYFPFGTCALAMSKCDVDIAKNEVKGADGSVDAAKTEAKKKTSHDTICGFATFGDPSKGEGAANTAYDDNIEEFTSCPSGDVLIDFVMPIEVMVFDAHADLKIRACFQGCKEDSDCHGFGVYDPVVKKQSGTKCQTVTNKAGEKAGVCFDMATVAGVEDTMQLISAGNYAK